MKKIMILFFAVTIVTAAHAQSSKDEARRVVLGQPKRTVSTQQQRNIILGKNGRSTNTEIYKPSRNRDYDYHKKNNHGKHLGWYKGVGNPHKYGVKPGKGNKKRDRDGDDD